MTEWTSRPMEIFRRTERFATACARTFARFGVGVGVDVDAGVAARCSAARLLYRVQPAVRSLGIASSPTTFRRSASTLSTLRRLVVVGWQSYRTILLSTHHHARFSSEFGANERYLVQCLSPLSPLVTLAPLLPPLLLSVTCSRVRSVLALLTRVFPSLPYLSLFIHHPSLSWCAYICKLFVLLVKKKQKKESVALVTIFLKIFLFVLFSMLFSPCFQFEITLVRAKELKHQLRSWSFI